MHSKTTLDDPQHNEMQKLDEKMYLMNIILAANVLILVK